MTVRANCDVYRTLIAGGLSACCAKTATAPLERLRILFQAGNRHFNDMGVIRALKTIYQREGLLGYYRGNGAMMVRVFPYGAVQFVSYEQYKAAFSTVYDDSVSKLLAGSMAGLTACALTYPLDVVRSRISFQVADEVVYCGVCHAGRQIIYNEGVRALYKGFTPTSLAMIPAVGLGFFCFENVKASILSTNSDLLTKSNANSGETVLSPLGGLICGACAGGLSQTFVYPLDVIRRRMQLAGAVSEGHKYNTCVGTFWTVYTEDGVRKGLYRGLSINYLRVVPQVAMMFMIFELSKQMLSEGS